MHFLLFIVLVLIGVLRIGSIRSPSLGISFQYRQRKPMQSCYSHRLLDGEYLPWNLVTASNEKNKINDDLITANNDSKLVRSMPHFAAGIVAGIFECLVGHPLDTIRVIAMSGTDKQSSSVIAACQRICSSKDGVFGLYRGAWSEVLSAAAAGSALFGVNDLLKRVFGRCCDDEDIEYVDRKLLCAAAITGFMDGVICKPFELVKSRQQFVSDWSTKSMTECTKLVYREGGVAAFFRGLLPTVIRETIGNVAFFAAYHQTKCSLLARNRRLETTLVTGTNTPALMRPNPFSNGTIALISGAAAGLAYVLSSQPLELASILMQTDHPRWITGQVPNAEYLTPVYQYQSMRDCFAQILARDGYRGLYKGTVPTVIRALPTYGAAIWGYELTLRAWQKLKHNSFQNPS